jgi:metal-dependent amidase/aminoacylase/carboxypeptidase family protein
MILICVQPHRTIDPAVLAAHIVIRLQTIISREINPADISVLTVGSLNAGHTENIISDTAEIGIDIRSILPSTRDKILSSIKRIVKAECEASGAKTPPVFKMTRHLPNTVNNEAMMKVLNRSFEEYFGEKFDNDIPVTTISEDFSVLATAVGRPCVFWHFGSIEGERWDRAVRDGTEGDIPANHTARFAPVIQPTLRTGIDALCVAALVFFHEKVESRL